MMLDESSRRAFGTLFLIFSVIIFCAPVNGLYEYYLTGHISFGRGVRRIDGPLAAVVHVCALFGAPVACRNSLRMMFSHKP